VVKLKKELQKLENKYEEAMTKLDQVMSKNAATDQSRNVEKRVRRRDLEEEEDDAEEEAKHNTATPPKRRIRIGQGLWK